MKKINIDERVPVRSTGHSSKGNQLKWELDGFWYKADGLGYEGLAEIAVSKLLEMSSVTGFVKYEPVQIKWQGRIYDGCMSRNFRKEGWQIVTVEKLYRQMTGLSIAGEMAKYYEVEDRISLFVRFVQNTTGLSEFGEYLATMLEMDAFFLNEDRHTNNIAVMYYPRDEIFDYCPYFDFGAGLYSDILGDYPLEQSIEKCSETIVAKPFFKDFDIQTETAVKMYGSHFRFETDKKSVLEAWKEIRKEYTENSVRHDANSVAERVEEVLQMQIRKYGFYVKN